MLEVSDNYQNGYNSPMKNNILKLRNEHNLSQQKLAELAGTTGPQINRLEKGERRLTVEWIERLANALNVTPAEVLGGLKPAGKRPIESDPRYNEILVKVLDAWNTKSYKIQAVDLIPLTKEIFIEYQEASDEELNIVIDTLLRHNAKK